MLIEQIYTGCLAQGAYYIATPLLHRSMCIP